MRLLFAAVAIMTVSACSGGGVSGPIGRACMEGGRSAANPALCSCIQQVADQTLSTAEQRRGARFFEDPQRAQDLRTADDQRSEDAWRRWRAFADTATAACG